MIIKMRKYTFLIYHKMYLDFLDKIREIGVLHVLEKAQGISEDEDLINKMKFSTELNTTLNELKKKLPVKAISQPEEKNIDRESLLANVKEQLKQLELLNQELVAAQRELDRISVWGDFSVQSIKSLEASGFELRFFASNLRKYNPEWETLYNAFKINTAGPMIYFVTVNPPGTELDIDADPVIMPEANSVEMAAKIAALQSNIETVNTELEKLAVEKLQTLDSYSQHVQSEVDFSRIVLNTATEVDNKVMILEGFCPEEAEAPLKDYLNK